MTFSSGNDVLVGMSRWSKRVGVYGWEFSIRPRRPIERVFKTIEKLHSSGGKVHDDVIKRGTAWRRVCILSRN